jgi:hypothetical protein
MFRYIVCLLATFGLNGLLYAFWPSSHGAVFAAHPWFPWWAFVGLLFFCFCLMKIKK